MKSGREWGGDVKGGEVRGRECGEGDEIRDLVRVITRKPTEVNDLIIASHRPWTTENDLSGVFGDLFPLFMLHLDIFKSTMGLLIIYHGF